MAKQGGLSDRLLIAGNNLSGDVTAIGNLGGGPAALDCTGIDKSAFERIGGVRDGRAEFTSWWNPTGAHPVLSALPTGSQIVTYCRGVGTGSPAAGLISKQINYDPTRGNDGALTLATNFMLSDGVPLEWCTQLTNGIITQAGAANTASVDGTASSSFGLVAYLQVLAFTGTSVTVTIEDSANNTDFTALTGGAFAAASAIGAQRIATSTTATVRRYLRVATSGTFSNAQFLVAILRSETLRDYS